MNRVLCAFLSLLALAAGVRADEIHLKDGSKIIGNIVGYQDGSFKVETAYGFAIVRKDSVTDIITTEPKQPAPPKAAPGKPAEDATPAPAKPAVSAEAKPQPASAKPAAPAEPGPRPAPAKSADSADAHEQTAPAAKPSPEASPQAAETPAAPAVTAAAAPPPPAPPPEPPTVQELVRGNLYINQTYGFQMYRPPDWQPVADARAALPNAIAALGTSDQTTLLVIGRERAHDSLDAHSAATENALREIYENYRPLPPKRTTVAGSPAIERDFRGSAEKRDWSVVLVTLVREGDVFTILAMTDANSDLVQIQENVIAKAIASLQFASLRG